MLNRDAILKADDRRTAVVEVPEWGGSVTIAEMSGKDRDAFEAAFMDESNRFVNLRARMCAISVVDEAGARLFTDADIEALGKKSGKALDRVFSAIQRLNALSDADIEEIQGN